MQARFEDKAKEGWEYSRLFSTKFHLKEQKIDLVRRRRWHRKLVASGASNAPVFLFKDEVCLSFPGMGQARMFAMAFPFFDAQVLTGKLIIMTTHNLMDFSLT